jgi:hypothetical protein
MMGAGLVNELDPRIRAFRKEKLTMRLERACLSAGRPRWWLATTVAALLWFAIFAALHSFAPVGGAIAMTLQSDRAGSAQWFYDRGNGYSEGESTTAKVVAGENHVIFFLTPGTYRALRFDPINNDGHVRIESARMTASSGNGVDRFALAQFAPLANIGSFARSANGIDVTAVAGSADPQLEMALAAPLEMTSPRSFVSDGFGALALTCALLLALRLAYVRLRIQGIVVAGMALAFGLILSMACISSTTQSLHPDEFSHLPAFRYFTEHWLPPAVDDPAVVPSLSIYGASYMFDLNAAYFIAASVMAPVGALFTSEVWAARTFQCMLWALLMLIVLRDAKLALPLSVLLLSPQVWYIFSYFNSDALPLFLGLTAVISLCGSKSGVHAYLANERKISVSVFLFASYLGLLLICKANYLVLVPGLLLWLAVLYVDLRWRETLATLVGLGLLGTSMFMDSVPAVATWHAHFVGLVAGIALILFAAVSASFRCLRDAVLRQSFLRLIAICALAIAVAAPRILLDFWVNGTPASKSARITAVQEKYAGTGFKPSQIAHGNGITNTALNVKGVGLSQMLIDSPYRWLQTSLLSSFGVYGYMSVYAPYPVYVCLAACMCAIALLAAIALARSRRDHGARLLALSAGICLLTLLSSILESWIFDFQPQGRYLFPIFAMLALVLGHAAPKLSSGPFKVLLIASMGLSAYSFLCVALPAFMHVG